MQSSQPKFLLANLATVCYFMAGQAFAMGISVPKGTPSIISNGTQPVSIPNSVDPIGDTQPPGTLPASLLAKPDAASVTTTKAATGEASLQAALKLPLQAQGIAVAGVDPALSELIARCAPTVHPETMAAVISAESRGHQFAIADAGPVHLPWSKRKSMVRSHYPSTMQEAVTIAENLIARGHTVSLGVAQVNDRNLSRMGVSIKDMFDPCTNVSVGGKILTDFYERAVKKFGAGPGTLQAALSAYNSGDWTRGARDGYVNLIYKQVGKPLTLRSQRVVPKLSGTSAMTSIPAAASQPGAKGMLAARYTPTAPRASAQVPREFGGQREFTMRASNFSVAEMR